MEDGGWAVKAGETGGTSESGRLSACTNCTASSSSEATENKNFLIDDDYGDQEQLVGRGSLESLASELALLELPDPPTTPPPAPVPGQDPAPLPGPAELAEIRALLLSLQAVLQGAGEAGQEAELERLQREVAARDRRLGELEPRPVTSVATQTE